MAKRKNAAAVALAKRRAKKLSPARRKEIAAAAARAKWSGLTTLADRRKAVSAANAARRKPLPAKEL